MDIQIIAVPYDTARRADGMGAGPEHWLARGLADHLTESQHTVQVTVIEDDDPRPAEIKTAFTLNRQLAAHVASRETRFPLVLAGNCNTALGTLSGLEAASDTAVIWFDAHGDFNTPDTSGSGFFDGMGLTIVAGLTWQRLAATIPGFSPTPGHNIIHVGGRAFDSGEREALLDAGAAVVDAASLHRDGIAPLETALSALPSHVTRAYIHLDLDVLDPDAGLQANRFPEPNGLSIEQVQNAIRAITSRLTPAALAITAYDPGFDPDDHVLNAGLSLIRTSLETHTE